MKFWQKFFPKFVGSNYFCDILRAEGFDIGKGTIFYAPNSQIIDRQRPWMLKIGEYCKITRGCTILTHDYSRSVLRRKYGEFVGEAAMTEIGNNVFIGVNTIILMGAKVGSNVIIGAGSVVSGSIPDNVVAAGNPAKVICSLEDFYKKRKERELRSAAIFLNSYKEKYGSYPKERFSGPFFSLFSNRLLFDYENDVRLRCNGDNVNELIQDFKKTKPVYNSYEEFLTDIENYV